VVFLKPHRGQPGSAKEPFLGRRSDHSREELRERILAAGEKIVSESGGASLTARRLADRIEYSVGTLYNFFEDLDDLVIHINARTLDHLYAACARVTKRETPEEALRAYARAYLRFTKDRQHLWAMLLDGSSHHHRELPEWYQAKVGRLLGLVEEALGPLVADEHDRRRSAQVLWASLHGTSLLAAVGAVAEKPSDLVYDLITHYVSSLRRSRAPI
jgi:AcrR family transcriptional regulator